MKGPVQTLPARSERVSSNPVPTVPPTTENELEKNMNNEISAGFAQGSLSPNNKFSNNIYI